MANLEDLRARMDTLGRRIAEAQGHGGADASGHANIRQIAERHAALHDRLTRSERADSQVEGEVEALLGAFDRWAKAQDREFGTR